MKNNFICDFFKLKKVQKNILSDNKIVLEPSKVTIWKEIILLSVSFLILVLAIIFKATNALWYDYFYIYLIDLNFGLFVWFTPFLIILFALLIALKLTLKNKSISLTQKWLYFKFSYFYKKIYLALFLFLVALVLLVYISFKINNRTFVVFSYSQSLESFKNGWYKLFYESGKYQKHLGLWIDTLLNFVSLIFGTNLFLVVLLVALIGLALFIFFSPILSVQRKFKKHNNYYEFWNALKRDQNLFIPENLQDLFDLYFYLEKETKDNHLFPYLWNLSESLASYIKNNVQLEVIYNRFKNNESIKDSILADSNNLDLVDLLEKEQNQNNETNQNEVEETKQEIDELDFDFGSSNLTQETKFNKISKGENNDSEI